LDYLPFFWMGEHINMDVTEKIANLKDYNPDLPKGNSLFSSEKKIFPAKYRIPLESNKCLITMFLVQEMGANLGCVIEPTVKVVVMDVIQPLPPNVNTNFYKYYPSYKFYHWTFPMEKIESIESKVHFDEITGTVKITTKMTLEKEGITQGVEIVTELKEDVSKFYIVEPFKKKCIDQGQQGKVLPYISYYIRSKKSNIKLFF